MFTFMNGSSSNSSESVGGRVIELILDLVFNLLPDLFAALLD